MMRTDTLPALFSAVVVLAACTHVEAQQSPVIEVALAYEGYETFGAALAHQVTAGDGNGIDEFFRNSGVVLDEEANAYFAVNGVHPVNRGDYSSYYPKSIVMASLQDDTIMRVYPFRQVNGHEVDMEALTFAAPSDYLYVGDEYNLIYELDLETGEILREWDLADVGIETGVDRGIEAIAYSPRTGFFYAGIQGTGSIVVLDVSLEGGETVTRVDEFGLMQGWSPSGLTVHADGSLYVVAMSRGGQAGNQKIFRYQDDGTLLCAISIPTELGMTRPDGIVFDSSSEFVYVVDSQGPIYGGHSLYKIPWTDPCSG